MPKPTQSTTMGIFWMVLTGIFFVAVTAVVKSLDGAVPAAQAAFLRYFLGLVFVIPMIRPIAQAKLTRRQWTLFGVRGVAHTLGVALWFYGMATISIAEVTAMNYMSPIYVTIGAALVLGETLAARRILAIAAALLGALIILRPGFRALELGHLAMVGTALMFAAGYLVAKIMSDEVSPTVVVGMLSITVTIGLAPLAYAVWVTPTLSQLGWLFVVACLATAGHYTMTFAFAAAPLTVTQPVTFLQLVWAALLGAVFFAEPIDPWVVIGGMVIVSAVIFITLREAKLKRGQITPPANATKG